MNEYNVVVIKKDNTHEKFNPMKIINAVEKSAYRALSPLTDDDKDKILKYVEDYILNYDRSEITVPQMHNLVESALETVKPEVAKSYRDYRNYKTDFVEMINSVYKKAQSIMYIGDKENSNTDSALVSTKRSLIYNQLNKELYQKFFMTTEELQACRDGYIYIHDMSARRDTMNCFHKNTKFITSEGVRSFTDYCDGDEIVVLTHKGNWKKAVVRSYGHQALQKITFKRGSGNPFYVYATKNHRWILKDGSETTNLKIGDKLIYTPVISEFNWNDLSLKEKKLWCYGFGIADGSVVKDNGIPTIKIRLCGNKTRFSQRFIDAGYTVTYPNSLKGDGHVILKDKHNKNIPYLELNYNNTKYFVDGILSADGNLNKNNSINSLYRGIQVTGSLNDFIYDLLNISGYYVTRINNLTDTETNYGFRSKLTLNYGFYSNCGDRTWFVENIEDSPNNSNAKVWCLEVEDDHSFVLEGGIPTGNCCLFNIANVLNGGFEMGNVWYNEPKTLDTAFDVIGDVTLAAASQQYGGFTLPRIDEVLSKYAELSYNKYIEEETENYKNLTGEDKVSINVASKIEIIAMDKVERDMEQGFQGWEYKFNTVSSSRGDYPFTTITIGLGTDKFSKLASKVCLKVRGNGQGAEGKKKAVLFPKIVFTYTEELHGPGKVNEDLFEAGIDCSSKAMYPDWLSLDGDTSLSEMYHKYGELIAPMGCRAFLSPYWVKGGQVKDGDDDHPVFTGRWNAGAISLHLPMILAKARHECKDFYEVLDYYLELIRGVHKRTKSYLSKMRASINPLAFCEGGFYKGNLDFHDEIKPLLDYVTFSFGITALNELNVLYNGKTIREDGEFPLEVMKYINNKLQEFKKEDHILYAVYGTPAESLCETQIHQFRKIYGIIENVSDRLYVSNSFHCHVTEEMNPDEKQDKEFRFWNLFGGGRIQYVKYPVNYNRDAIVSLVRRAMKMGLYEGVNLSLAYCNNCGYEELSMDVCPKCGSKDLTKIERMNGYLSYSRVHGDTRLNAGKMAEIADRVSM